MNSDRNPELVARAAHGDDAAMNELVATWLPDVERAVQRRAPREILRHESSADLAQSVCREALMRIQRGAVEYQGEAQFRAWLLGAVDLKLRDRWKRNHAQRREGELRPALDVEQAGLALSETSPSGHAERNEQRERFAALIGRLDERSQEVVRAIQLEGRSHAAVAAQLGIEESHSRTILARALARLAGWARSDAADD